MERYFLRRRVLSSFIDPFISAPRGDGERTSDIPKGKFLACYFAQCIAVYQPVLTDKGPPHTQVEDFSGQPAFGNTEGHASTPQDDSTDEVKLLLPPLNILLHKALR
jgi:hypothetical protein